MKRLFAFLLAFAMVLSLLPVTAMAEELTADTGEEAVSNSEAAIADSDSTISVGESRTLTLQPQEEMCYTFTAEKDGTVVAHSPSGEVVTDQETGLEYTQEFCLEIRAEDGSAYSEERYYPKNVVQRMDVVSGQRYVLRVYNPGAAAITETIYLEEAAQNNGGTLECDKETGYTGETISLRCYSYPLNSVDTFTWTVEDESIASIEYSDSNHCTLRLNAAGVTTVTTTPAGGLSQSRKITVMDESTTESGNERISVGESRTLTLGSGEEKYYTIIPEKDCSVLAYMPYGEPALDPEYNIWYAPQFSFILSAEDYSQSGLTIGTPEYCGARMDMVAGKTYILCVRNTDSFHTFTGTFRLEEKPAVESVALDLTDVSVTVGSSVSFNSQCAPELAFGTVSWSISDESIATFDWSGEQACSVKLLAPGTVTITATTPNGLSASCVITATEMEQISIGESRTVTLKPMSHTSYTFTADKDCEIVAYAARGEEFYDEEYNSHYRPCLSFEAWSEAGVNSHYISTANYSGMKYFISAGQTYTLTVSNYNRMPLTGEFFLVEPDPIESLSISKTVINGTSKSEIYLTPIAEPETAFATFDWSSSDYSIADFSMLDYAFCYLYLRDPGTATVTATSTTGLTVSCTVNVTEMEKISLGETKTATLDHYEAIAYTHTAEKDGTVIVYMPEGEYRYDENSGNGNVGHLESFEFFIDAEDYSTTSRVVDIPGYVASEIDVTAGKTYNVHVYNYTTQEITGTFCLAESVTPQSISIRSDSKLCSVGDYVYAQVAPVPEISADSYSWTVSDPTVISVENSTGSYFGGTALKSGTATLTVTSGTGLKAEYTITVSDVELISCGETKNVTVPAGGTKQLRFNCEESGDYVFYIPATEGSGLRPVISAGNAQYGTVVNGAYYVTSCHMEAGSVYTLSVHNLYETDAAAVVTLDKAVDPASMELPAEAVTCYVGDHLALQVTSDSPRAVTGYSWSTSDESVLTPVMLDSNLCEFYAAVPGEVSVTVTHRNGLTDTCKVTILEVSEIHAGESVTETLEYGEYVKYRFTPEADDVYRVTTPVGPEVTTNNGEITTSDLYFYLVDSELFWIEQEFGVVDGVSYVSAELTAGQTYYLMVHNDVYVDGPITGTVTIDKYFPPHEHNYYTVASTDPTCTEKGYVSYSCSVCADSYTEEFDALGHSYGEWTTITEAACTATGEKRRECGVCGNQETERIPKTAHHFVDGFCIECEISEEDAKTLLGDANGDGITDNVDAMLILQYAVGLKTESELVFEVCDVSGDGYVDNVDAMRILQHAVGLIDLFAPVA